MAKLKVYYPKPDLGPSIVRRWVKLRELAPGPIELVELADGADIQVLSICRAHETALIRCHRYVLYIHNSLPLMEPDDRTVEVMEGAAMICSWFDYPRELPGKYPFTRLPQGADPNLFRDLGGLRDVDIGTTGFLGTYGPMHGEPILEAHIAARKMGLKALQIGPDVETEGDLMEVTGFLTDDQAVAAAYNRCRYVSGLRWQSGFECPTLEGLLCGCRPICFDLPDERHWWSGHARFVSHDREKIVGELEETLRGDPEPVGYAERDYLSLRYGWKNIAREFWGLLLSL